MAAGFAWFLFITGGRGASFDGYELSARFRSVQGVGPGTDVRVAGIRVGSVSGIELDTKTYEAETIFSVRSDLELPEDSTVRIASEGLLGGAFLEVEPGKSEFILRPGDEIADTRGAVSLLNLLMRYGSSQ